MSSTRRWGISRRHPRARTCTTCTPCPASSLLTLPLVFLPLSLAARGLLPAAHQAAFPLGALLLIVNPRPVGFAQPGLPHCQADLRARNRPLEAHRDYPREHDILHRQPLRGVLAGKSRELRVIVYVIVHYLAHVYEALKRPGLDERAEFRHVAYLALDELLHLRLVRQHRDGRIGIR